MRRNLELAQFTLPLGHLDPFRDNYYFAKTFIRASLIVSKQSLGTIVPIDSLPNPKTSLVHGATVLVDTEMVKEILFA